MDAALCCETPATEETRFCESRAHDHYFETFFFFFFILEFAETAIKDQIHLICHLYNLDLLNIAPDQPQTCNTIIKMLFRVSTEREVTCFSPLEIINYLQ